MDHNVHDLFDRDPWEDEPPGWIPPWYDDEYARRPGLDRLTHLVLVDGRLVDVWSEPVRGTRWQRIADEYDAERRPTYITPEPQRHPHEQALEWLDTLVGGRVNLEALGTDPLPAPPEIPWERLPLASRHRLEAVTQLLDHVTSSTWDDEVGSALGAALAELWEVAPETVLHGKSAAHVAGGICWAVGRANDLFGSGKVTQQHVQRQLGLGSAISGSGQSVHRALVTFQPLRGHRIWTQPDRLALGSPAFLTSATRRSLVRLRDQAIAARDAHLADEARKGAVLP